MARSVGNITTGGQLLGIYGGNFVASIKWPLYLSLGVTFALVTFGFWHGMSEQQVYFCGMRMWAWLWNWLELSETRQMVLNVTRAHRIQLTAVDLMTYGPVASAWNHASTLVRTWAAYGMLFAIPACVGWVYAAERFGAHAREEKFEKGAILVSHRELLAAVAAYNDLHLAPRYRAALGALWRLQLRTTKAAELAAAGIYQPYTIADVPFPAETEQSHVMLVGSTGKGKTVVMRDLVRQVRERGGRAVIFDLTGAFVESFYDPQRDVILNPTDTRCPQWSIFNECDHEVEFNNAAMALIPSTGEKDDFWKPAARTLFVDIAMRLKREGRGTNQALHDELMTAELASLHELAKNTPAAPLTDPDAPKMAEGIRSTFNINARALRLLPTTGALFSVREWVLQGVLPHAADVPAGRPDGRGGRVGDERPRRADGILFLTSRHIDMATTRVLLTLWMDTAVNTLMTMPQSKRLRMWFILDEVGALHRLPSIENGMQAARQYGGAFVLGIHAFAKLADTYGENIAMTLSSYANTKLVMGTADHGTAKWASETIGAQMFREMEEGYSYGQTNVRDAVSLTPRKVTEALVIPDQLMKLPKLWGYLVFPEGMPVACVPVRIRQYRQMAIGFEQRAIKDDPWTADNAAADVVNEPAGHGPDAPAGDDLAVKTSMLAASNGHAASSGETKPTAAKRAGKDGSKARSSAARKQNEKVDEPASAPDATTSEEQLPLQLDGANVGKAAPGKAGPKASAYSAAEKPEAKDGPSNAPRAGQSAGSICNLTVKGTALPPSSEPSAETRKVRPGSAVAQAITAAVNVRASGSAAVSGSAASGGGATGEGDAVGEGGAVGGEGDAPPEKMKDESEGPGGADSGAPPDTDREVSAPESEQAEELEKREPQKQPVAARQPAFPDNLRRTAKKQAKAENPATRELPTPDPKSPPSPEHDEPPMLQAVLQMSDRARPRAPRQQREGKRASAQQRSVQDGSLTAAVQDGIEHAQNGGAKGTSKGAVNEAMKQADGVKPEAAKAPGRSGARRDHEMGE